MRSLRTPLLTTMVLLIIGSMGTLEGRLTPSVQEPSAAKPLLPPCLDACAPPPCFNNPSAYNCLWAPYGPFTSQLEFSFYPDQNLEYYAFLAGHLDLTDFPVTNPPFNPDFHVSTPLASYQFDGIDFNEQSQVGPGVTNTWASWGCNFENGNSPCGVNIRQAFTYLIDRSSLGLGWPIADPTSIIKDPGQSAYSTQNSWETLPALSGKTDGAYHISFDPSGFAAPGSPDFCAAALHLQAADIGISTTGSYPSCSVDPNSPGLANIAGHPIRFVIANDRQRNLLGQGLTNAINQLFGRNVVTKCVVPPLVGSCIINVFTSPPYGPIDDWDMYTYGWKVQGPFTDHLQALYGSLAASDQCGGSQTGFTENYGLVCISSFDNYVNAAMSASDVSTFRTDTLAALDQFGSHAVNIPVFAKAFQNVALEDMAGLVKEAGVGFPNSWSVLNGENNPEYTPYNPLYTFGGGTNVLRYGSTGIITDLNPFNAQYVTDVRALGEIYDNLFIPSPIEPTKVLCWMCNRFTQSVDGAGNTHFLVELRESLTWQDGVPLDAKDVKFSLLNLREFSSILGTGAESVQDVTVFSDTFFDITMKGQSFNQLVNLATVPIVPRHLWELSGDTTFGDVGRVDSRKLSDTFDPLASGMLVGSGPFACVSLGGTGFPPAGRIGAGCGIRYDGTPSGQTILPGDRLVLAKYDFSSGGNPFYQYMRSFSSACPSSPPYPVACSETPGGQFQEWSWADQNNDGVVSIVDLASVLACVNGPSVSCPSSNYDYWHRMSTGTTLTIEAVRVAAHLDDTWTSPYAWDPSVLQGIVPFTP